MAAGTFSEIFKPVDGDYALISLQRILGCVVSTIWQKDSCAATSDLISTAAGFFNIAVAIVAGILITYTVWTGISDTARDGEAMGGSSFQYSVARTGFGAILLLPISNGFSLAQILVIQLVVWGSGAGDRLWIAVTGKIATGGYSQMATFSDQDARMRGMLADAIRVRAIGYVCQYRLNEVATSFGKGAPISPNSTSTNAWLSSSTKSIAYGFADTSGFYNRSNSLCGSVSYVLGSAMDFPADADSVTDSQDQTAYATLQTIGVTALKTGITNAWTAIDQSAQAIARQVYTEQRNDDKVRSLIDNGVSAAQIALASGVNMTMNADKSKIATLSQSYLSASAENGWVFAISWQRANINLYQFFESLVKAMTISTTPPPPIANILQPMAQPGLFGSAAQLNGSMWRTVADNYERDMGYLKDFNGYFANFGNVARTGVGGIGVKEDGGAGVSSFFRWLLGKLSVAGPDEKVAFSDPLANLVTIGVGLTDSGLLALGAGGAAEVGSWFLPGVGGKALSGAGSAAWMIGVALVAIGFWLGGILPLAPLVYFFGGVMSWLAVSLEALVAMPIWVLTFFLPSRDNTFIGASRQGFLLLFGLLARPALIIFGLLVSVLMMFAGFVIMNIMFRSVFALMMPVDGGAITSMIISVGALVMYATAATIVVMNSCAMITELGDAALRWVDLNVANSLWSARFGGEAMQPMSPSGGVAGTAQRMGGSAGGMLPGVQNLRRVYTQGKGPGGSDGSRNRG